MYEPVVGSCAWSRPRIIETLLSAIDHVTPYISRHAGATGISKYPMHDSEQMVKIRLSKAGGPKCQNLDLSPLPRCKYPNHRERGDVQPPTLRRVLCGARFRTVSGSACVADRSPGDIGESRVLPLLYDGLPVVRGLRSGQFPCVQTDRVPPRPVPPIHNFPSNPQLRQRISERGTGCTSGDYGPLKNHGGTCQSPDGKGGKAKRKDCRCCDRRQRRNVKGLQRSWLVNGSNPCARQGGQARVSRNDTNCEGYTTDLA